MNTARNYAWATVLAAVVLLALLIWRPGGTPAAPGRGPLLVYCAAGLKPQAEAIARDYEKEFGVPVQLQFGGSGTLLGNMRASRRGDLFLAGDEGYLDLARSNHLVAETIPIAGMRAVMAVAPGNPKDIRTLDDLLRDDVRLALANPDAAAIGQLLRTRLAGGGRAAALEQHATVFKPTVTDVATDVKLGALDAGIVWDATLQQYPGLTGVMTPELDEVRQRVSIGVLTSSEQPAAALRFARYLCARDRGLREFAKAGYEIVDGDAWAETPEVVVFSGAVNRIVIEETLRRFEEREGCRVTRVYNGCGILVSQIKAGQRPDGYFACDVSFVPPVQEWFGPATNLSETDIVLLVPNGNPKQLRTLKDLATPGLKLGVANARQSTLGNLTERLLRSVGLFEPVMANVTSQTPTADLLVNQMRTGSLDAVIVYEANASQVGEICDVVRLGLPGATATQPFAIGTHSAHRQLMNRLLQALSAEESQKRFEALGFRRAGAPPNS